jgi:hypothetical protein
MERGCGTGAGAGAGAGAGIEGGTGGPGNIGPFGVVEVGTMGFRKAQIVVGAVLGLGACAGPAASGSGVVPVVVPAASAAPAAEFVGVASRSADAVRVTEPPVQAPQPKRVERAIPAPFPIEASCRRPITAFCGKESCATLDDFRRVFACRHIALERCGEFRALTVIAPLAGFVALFDAQGKLVAGERWTDSEDFCDGRAREAWFGPRVRCAPSGEFEPWCADGSQSPGASGIGP